MTRKQNYTCPRCGYDTNRKSSMHTHLFKVIKPCPTTADDIELTNDVKEYIIMNRKYRPPKVTKQTKKHLKTIQQYHEENNKLKIELMYLKNKRSEKFYQTLLETYTGETHKRLPSGITDITTDISRIEIKN